MTHGYVFISNYENKYCFCIIGGLIARSDSIDDVDEDLIIKVSVDNDVNEYGRFHQIF